MKEYASAAVSIAAVAAVATFFAVTVAAPRLASEPALSQVDDLPHASASYDETGDSGRWSGGLVKNAFAAEIGDIPLSSSSEISQQGETVVDGSENGSSPYASSGGYWLSASSHAYGSQAAIDAGGIVEYQPGFYAAHNYDAGSVFLGFSVGDVVHIDGYDVVIEGYDYVNTDVDDTYSIRNRVGYDKVCFQTCTDSGSTAIVYYGTIPGANFDGWMNNDGTWGDSAQAADDEAYNNEAYALQAEQAQLDAEYESICAELEAAYESLDPDAIAAARRRADDYESRLADYNARADDHNSRF